MGTPVAHPVEHVPRIKAESLPQQPGFDSTPGPLLNVILSLSLSLSLPAFYVSLHLTLP